MEAWHCVGVCGGWQLFANCCLLFYGQFPKFMCRADQHDFQIYSCTTWLTLSPVSKFLILIAVTIDDLWSSKGLIPKPYISPDPHLNETSETVQRRPRTRAVQSALAWELAVQVRSTRFVWRRVYRCWMTKAIVSCLLLLVQFFQCANKHVKKQSKTNTNPGTEQQHSRTQWSSSKPTGIGTVWSASMTLISDSMPITSLQYTLVLVQNLVKAYLTWVARPGKLLRRHAVSKSTLIINVGWCLVVSVAILGHVRS